jgi:hypothetical protein
MTLPDPTSRLGCILFALLTTAVGLPVARPSGWSCGWLGGDVYLFRDDMKKGVV